MPFPIKLFFISLLLLAFSGCSTRQPTDVLTGSTAQRLVTYSVEKLIDDLPEKMLSAIKSKNVFLQSHFLETHPLAAYTDRLLRLKLQSRFQPNWVLSHDEADIELDFFFTSIGTDFDVFGLSLPFLDMSGTGNGTRINVLSIEMYHGIAEAHFFLNDLQNQRITQSERISARIRTDNIATPIITFPYNQLD